MPSKFLSDVNPTLQSKMNNLDLSAQLPADMKAVSIPPMTTDREALKHVEREVNNLALVLAPVSTQWRFNPKHGEAICLSNEGHTVMVRKASPYAELGRIILTFFRSYIAVAGQSMSVNTVYEVKVDAGDNPMLWLTCGALLTPVGDVTLPNAARGGWNHAVVFAETVFDRGSIIKHKTKELRGKLYRLQVGSRVGLVIDHARRLHLLVDGNDVIQTADVPSPCFAFFELNESCTRITTLPLRQFDPHQ